MLQFFKFRLLLRSSNDAMGSKKPSARNPKKLQKPLGPNKLKKKKNSKNKEVDDNVAKKIRRGKVNELETGEVSVKAETTEQRLGFFLNQFESVKGVRISSLELESIQDKCMVELSQDLEQDVNNLGQHIQTIFGSSFKEVLCGNQLVEEKIDPGNPAVLVISASALRSLDLLRGMRSLTKQCPAVKLFSKHMKVEEQVSLLKKRVNIGSGTPSRIKKLIDIEALGLSRLEVIILDAHVDLKGFSLFTLPQVRDEFWDLYNSWFHPRVLQGNLRICLYGQIPTADRLQDRKKKKDVDN